MKQFACVLFGFLLVGGVAAAHHSYEAYDRDQQVTVEGRLEKLVFANPHVMLLVKSRGGETFTAEWGNVTALGRAGVTKDTLRVGDSLVIVGVPTKDRSLHRVSLLKEIRRPADGWTWQKPAMRQPENEDK